MQAQVMTPLVTSPLLGMGLTSLWLLLPSSTPGERSKQVFVKLRLLHHNIIGNFHTKMCEDPVNWRENNNIKDSAICYSTGECGLPILGDICTKDKLDTVFA